MRNVNANRFHSVVYVQEKRGRKHRRQIRAKKSAGEPGATGPTDTTAAPSAAGGAQGGSLQNASLQDLVIAANLHYTNAQNELRAGNWAGYGEEMNALQAVIEQMMALSGVQLEGTATPDAAETPQSSVPTEETPPGE